jgi:hypothetical protein
MVLVVIMALLISSLACSALGGPGVEPTATPRVEATPEEDPTEVEDPTEEPSRTPRPTRTAQPEQDPTDTPEPEATETPEEEPTETPEAEPGDVLFEDDFSDPDSGWSEDEDDTARREYVDGEYVIEVLDTGWLIWNTAGLDDLANTHTTVTAANVGDAQDPAFGVICNYIDTDAFYYMGAGPDGYYAIVRAEGDDDIFLTSDADQWEFSDEIEQFAEAYVLEAICAGDGTLTLIVNGVEIASVQDDAYAEGDIGVFVLSFEEAPVEVHFDDLVVTDAQ